MGFSFIHVGFPFPGVVVCGDIFGTFGIDDRNDNDSATNEEFDWSRGAISVLRVRHAF